MQKFIQKIKEYVKENYKFLLFLVVLYLVLTFPLPYYIYTGGGIMPVDKKIEISSSYQEKGSFNLAYVSEWRGTITTMLLSKVFKNWEVVPKEEYILSEDDSEEDIFFRNKVSLDEANQIAIQLAYQKAGKSYKIKKRNFYVLYVENQEKTPLKVGDNILKVEGKTIENVEEYKEAVKKMEVGEKLALLIERKGKEKEVQVEVFLENNEKITGISVTEIDEYQTNPKISLHFSPAEGGPSGGLMTTLAIYNRLTKKDITKGLTIVGTGTIDKDGHVGAIGGVLYKLQGAVKAKADVFIAPAGENYEECKKAIKENHYAIKLISASTFDEVLKKLDQLEKKS